MHGAVIKLDSLSDPDRSGSENQHLLFIRGLNRLVLPVKAGVVIRRKRLKLGGAGINHLEGGDDAVFAAGEGHLGT